MSSEKTGLTYCAQEVREHDHDRYLTALFAPAAVRDAVFALYAFNVEIARTREIVSEPILGQIRLQWWRESLDGIYGGDVREHPVVEALAGAIAAYSLDRARFEAMIDAREADLDEQPPQDIAALEAYAGVTSGKLSELVMAVLSHREGAPVRAAHAVGTAWALIGLMRAVGFHAQSQRIYLPQELTDEYGVDRRALLDLKPSDALTSVVRDVSARAAELLAKARALKGDIPAEARRGLLLAVLAERYLADITRANFDPFALPPAAPARPLRLAWAALRRTY